MNSQIHPGSAEAINQLAHARLLHETANDRRLNGRGKRRNFTKAEKAQVPPLRNTQPRPTVLTPAITAVLTAGFALQVALLLSF